MELTTANRFSALEEEVVEEEVIDKQMQEGEKNIDRKGQKDQFSKMRHVHILIYTIFVILDRIFYLFFWLLNKIFGIKWSFMTILVEFDKWVDSQKQFDAIDRRRINMVSKSKIEKDKKDNEENIKQFIQRMKMKPRKKQKDEQKASSEEKPSEIVHFTTQGTKVMGKTHNMKAFGIDYKIKYSANDMDITHEWLTKTKTNIVLITIKNDTLDEMQIEKSPIERVEAEHIIIICNNDGNVLGQYIKTTFLKNEVVIMPQELGIYTDKIFFNPVGSKIMFNMRLTNINVRPCDEENLTIMWRDQTNKYIQNVSPQAVMYYRAKGSATKIVNAIITRSSQKLPYGTIIVNIDGKMNDIRTMMSNATRSVFGMLVTRVEVKDTYMNVFECVNRAMYIPEFTAIRDD